MGSDLFLRMIYIGLDMVLITPMHVNTPYGAI